jgi:hypothetical protein
MTRCQRQRSRVSNDRTPTVTSLRPCWCHGLGPCPCEEVLPGRIYYFPTENIHFRSALEVGPCSAQCKYLVSVDSFLLSLSNVLPIAALTLHHDSWPRILTVGYDGTKIFPHCCGHGLENLVRGASFKRL